MDVKWWKNTLRIKIFLEVMNVGLINGKRVSKIINIVCYRFIITFGWNLEKFVKDCCPCRLNSLHKRKNIDKILKLERKKNLLSVVYIHRHAKLYTHTYTNQHILYTQAHTIILSISIIYIFIDTQESHAYMYKYIRTTGMMHV